MNPMYPELDFKRIHITPIPETELRKEAEIMLEQARVRDEYDKQYAASK